MPLLAMVDVEGYSSARLAFSWARAENIPVILGQTNFFMDFDVCSYHSKLEFDINPKSE